MGPTLSNSYTSRQLVSVTRGVLASLVTGPLYGNTNPLQKSSIFLIPLFIVVPFKPILQCQHTHIVNTSLNWLKGLVQFSFNMSKMHILVLAMCSYKNFIHILCIKKSSP